MMNMSWDGGGEAMRLPVLQGVLQGVLPVERSRVPADALAGLTLAAIGIPEVLGYAKIAGMPRAVGWAPKTRWRARWPRARSSEGSRVTAVRSVGFPRSPETEPR